MDYMYIRFTCYIDTFKSANLTFSVCFNVQILPKKWENAKQDCPHSTNLSSHSDHDKTSILLLTYRTCTFGLILVAVVEK